MCAVEPTLEGGGTERVQRCCADRPVGSSPASKLAAQDRRRPDFLFSEAPVRGNDTLTLHRSVPKSQGVVNLSEEGILEEKRQPRSVEDVAKETMGVDTPQRSRPFLKKEAAALKYYETLDRLDDEDHPKVLRAKKELDRSSP